MSDAAAQPDRRIIGRDPATGRVLAVDIVGSTIGAIHAEEAGDPTFPWLVPGYVDLQVNGYGGHDVNGPNVSAERISELTAALARRGTTTYVPTVVTGSEDAITTSLRAVADARATFPNVARAVPFVHVEGPFIAEEDGPRGAHDLNQVRPPSLAELERWQDASSGLVGIVTISPHHADSVEFTAGAVARGVRVAVGHTSATPEQIRAVTDAGASLSTHLGNGAHAVVPRHPNYIWTQLADDRLTAGFIADGHHLPAETLTAMLRAKGVDRSFFVSDSVALAGMTPGTYEAPVGGKVELHPDGRLAVAGTPYLAGAARNLGECVATAVGTVGLSVADAVRLATQQPAALVAETLADRTGSDGVGARDGGTRFETAGRILPGHRADLLLLDAETAEVIEVVYGGQSLA